MKEGDCSGFHLKTPTRRCALASAIASVRFLFARPVPFRPVRSASTPLPRPSVCAAFRCRCRFPLNLLGHQADVGKRPNLSTEENCAINPLHTTQSSLIATRDCRCSTDARAVVNGQRFGLQSQCFF